MSEHPVATLLKNGRMKIPHGRIAISLVEQPETYGDTPIYRPETYNTQPLMGHILGYGWGVSEEFRRNHYIGELALVSYTGIAASRDDITIEGVGTFQVTIVSEKDIWFTVEEE